MSDLGGGWGEGDGCTVRCNVSWEIFTWRPHTCENSVGGIYTSPFVFLRSNFSVVIV